MRFLSAPHSHSSQVAFNWAISHAPDHHPAHTHAHAQLGPSSSSKATFSRSLDRLVPSYIAGWWSGPRKAFTHGEDIRLSDEVRKAFPYSIEAKYKDKGLSKIYSALEQAQRQTEDLASTIKINPVAIIKQKGHEPLVVMSFEDWIEREAQLIRNAVNKNEKDIQAWTV